MLSYAGDISKVINDTTKNFEVKSITLCGDNCDREWTVLVMVCSDLG